MMKTSLINPLARLLLAGALSCPVLPKAAAQTYDPAADFSAANNPNGPWSYGYSITLGGPLIPYTSTDIVNGLNRWLTNIDASMPNVYHNPTSSTITSGSAEVGPGGFGLQPGPIGEFSVARLTVPSPGWYHLTGAFFGQDKGGGVPGVYTTTDVRILANGVQVFSGYVVGFGPGSGPSFDFVVRLNAGDHLDFAVGFGRDVSDHNDSTGLSAQIQGPVVGPVAITGDAGNLTPVSVTVNGSVLPNAQNSTAWFQYGATTNYGNTTARTISGANGGPVSVNSALTGLTPGTLYHCQLVASNSAGTSFGADTTFFTPLTSGPGSALSFNGAGQYVSISTTGSLTGTFTVEAWARVYDPTSPLTVVGSRSPLDWGFDCTFWQGHLLHGDIGKGNGWVTIAADANYTYSTGVYYHVAYVVTPTNYTIYADGQPVGGGSYSFSNPVLYDANHRLVIGSIGAGQYMVGQIDEVRIWNTARSASEIQTSMQGKLTGSESGLMGYWPFDEGAGTTTEDLSGHGFTGTLVNGPAWVQSAAPVGLLAVTTGNAMSVTPISAKLNGSIFPNAQNVVAWFQYGTSINYGSITAATNINAANAGSFSSFLTGLSPGTLYHYQLVALTGAGLTFGSDLLFATPRVVTTDSASDVTPASAMLNGTVVPIYPNTGAWFQYGTTTNYGFTTPVTNFSAAGVAAVALSNLVSGLPIGTLYHYQLVATNSGGTFVGRDVTFTTPVLSNLVAGLTGVNSGAVACGDFDNDGKLDILLTGASSPYSAVSEVWRNLGNGVFVKTFELPGVSSGSVALGDFDNDGYLDILLTGETNTMPVASIAQVWRNLGNGTFANMNVGLPGVGGSSVAWADFDNDGKLDILLTGNSDSGPISQIWRNLGNGVFTNINAGLPGVADGPVAVADFDNDGYLDVLLGGQLWRNLGNGVFTRINAGLPDVSFGSVAVGDFDNDGKLDILLTGLDAQYHPIAQVWLNLGNWSFTNVIALPALAEAGVAVGDFDNDGKLDFLFAGTDGNPTSQLWRNLGQGAFANVNTSLVGVRFTAAAWADFDNQGRLGLLLSGFSDDGYHSISQVYRSYTPITNNPPAAPTDLTAQVTGDTVLLTWNFASDIQTPASGLSYNLRVGTTPGGFDVISPQADPTTGFRRLPQLGNAQERRNMRLHLPPRATPYYWSVQAVDGSFAGSAFATEGTFVVSTPEAITAPASGLTPTSVVLNGTVHPNPSLVLGYRNTGAWFQYGTTTNYGNSTDVVDFTATSPDPLTLAALISGLSPGTLYHCRLVATNSAGVSLGADLTFTTPIWGATQPATGITLFGARLNGTVFPYPNTGAWFQYGTTTNYPFHSLVTDVSGTNRVAVPVGGLSPGTLYHFQLVMTNSAGTNAGGDLSFTTPAEVMTLPATVLSTNAAMLNGSVLAVYSNTGVWFQYGTTTNYGLITTLTNIGLTNSTPVPVNLLAIGLTPLTAYHYRAVVTNSAGTYVGNDSTFIIDFASVNSGLPPLDGYTTAWGDFDNDGHLDLLLSGSDANNNPVTQLWRNLGNGTFTNLNAGLPAVYAYSVALGDFDNDGYLDILLTGYDTNNSPVSQVWRNLGNGTFTNINWGAPGLYGNLVAWGDFDNDGYLDILVTGEGQTDSIQIWRNLGNGTFTNLSLSLPTFYADSVVVGDLDNDGYLDILLSGFDNYGRSTTQLWLNLGNGTFTNVAAGLPAIDGTSLAVGDFDNDGNLDVLLTGYGTNNKPVLCRNLGNGTFTNVNCGLPSIGGGAVAWGDFDNDGYLDILLSGYDTNNNPVTQLWRNLRNGSFANVNAALPVVSVRSYPWGGDFNGPSYGVSWGDFDDDGRLDMLLKGTDAAGNPTTLFLRNYTPATNTAPTAPTGLTARATTNAVVLSWNAATDTQTPAAGMSYNLRVGTTSGGYDILSPQADPATGFRRLPQLGNAQERLSATLTNLSIGKTYYWSVQAIDGSFAGSPFAAEASFSANVPVVTAPASEVTFTAATLNGSVNPSGIDCTAWFQWGTTTTYGNKTPPQHIGNGTAPVTLSQMLAPLQPGTTYYYGLVVTNIYGTAYGLPQSFTTPTNTSPSLSDFANLTTPENTPTGPITFTVSDAQTAVSNLVVSAISSVDSLVPPANLVVGGSGTNRTLTITPAQDQTGVAAIAVTVSDGLASMTKAFVLTVTAVNNPTWPLLKIMRAGTNVVVYWPNNATGFMLISAANLLPNTPWNIVTNVPAVVGDQFMVTNAATGPGRYYRLALSVGAPVLTGTRANRNLVLSWPTAAIGYTLQATTNLSPPRTWTPVTNTPVVAGDRYWVTNSMTGTSRFYRLMR
jgi:hypothetical protein